MANQSSWSRCGAIPSPSSQPFLIWRNSSSRAGTSSGSSKAVCSTDCMRTKRSCRSYLPSPCISTFTESRYRLNASMIASRCWSGTAPVILRPSINCSSKVIRSWSSSGMEPRMRTSAVNSLIRDDAKSNPRRGSFVSRAGVVRDGVTNSIDSPSRRLRHNPIEVAEALFRKMVNHRSVIIGRGDGPDNRVAGSGTVMPIRNQLRDVHAHAPKICKRAASLGRKGGSHRLSSTVWLLSFRLWDQPAALFHLIPSTRRSHTTRRRCFAFCKAFAMMHGRGHSSFRK